MNKYWGIAYLTLHTGPVMENSESCRSSAESVYKSVGSLSSESHKCVISCSKNKPYSLLSTQFLLKSFGAKQTETPTFSTIQSDVCLLHTQHFPLFGRACVGVMTPLHVRRALVLQSAQLDHVHWGRNGKDKTRTLLLFLSLFSLLNPQLYRPNFY